MKPCPRFFLRTYRTVGSALALLAFSGLALAQSGPAQPSGPELDSVIKEFEQKLADGQFPTADMRQSWWKANGDPYMGFLNKYTGLGSSTLTVLLAGETEGKGAFSTISTALDQLGLATTVYDVAAKLCEGKPNSRTLAFLSGAKYYLGNVLSKRGAGGALMNAGVGFIDYSLTSLGEHGVELSNKKWWQAYCAFQAREHPDGHEWLLMIQRDGNIEAIASQLDRFWLETEEVRGEDFFKTNNPDYLRDYRNRYLREQVLPAIKSWAETEKIKAAMTLKATMLSEAVKFQTARVRIVGEVRNFLESYTAQPERYLVDIADRPEKAEIGAGSFEFAIPLRDFKSGAMTVRLQSVGLTQRYEVAFGRGGITVAPGDPLRCTAGVKIKVWKDGTIVATLPPFLVGAIFGERVNPELPPGRVAVPPMPDDANDKIEAPARGAVAAYRSHSLEFEGAVGQITAQLQMIPAEASRQWEGMEARGRALARNAELDAAPLYAQKQSAAGDAIRRRAEEETRQLRLLVDSRNARREAFGTEMRVWVSAEEAALRARDLAIEAKLKAITEEMRRANQAADETQRDLGRVVAAIDEVAYMTSRRGQDPSQMDPMDSTVASEALQGLGEWGGSGSDPEAVLADKLAELQPRFTAAAARFLAAEQVWTSLQQRVESLNEEKAALVTQTRGVVAADFPFGGGSFLPSAESYLDGLSRHIEACHTFVETKTEKRVTADAPQVVRSIKRRLAARAACSQALAELEQLLASPAFPKVEQAKAAAGEFSALNNPVNAYLNYLGGLVNSPAAPAAAPAGVLDAGGSDAAFVKGRLEALRAFVDRNQALCGDLLPDELRQETDLTKAMVLQAGIAAQANILAYAVSQRWYKANQTVNEVVSQRRLGGLTATYSALRWLEPLGTTPAARAAAISKTAKALAADWRREATALTAAGRVPDKLPDQELDASATRLQALLVAAGKTGGIPRVCCPVELREARALLRQAVSASGRFDLWRQRRSLPAAPKSVTVLGQTYPLDGRLVRIPAAQIPAAASPGAPRLFKFVFTPTPPLKLELRSFDNSFGGSFDGSMSFGLSAQDEGRAVAFEVAARHVDQTGRNSWLDGDTTCLTLLIEP